MCIRDSYRSACDMQMTQGLVGGSGEQSSLEAKTSFWTFNGSCKFACFLMFGDAKNHSYLQSAWSKIIFPNFFRKIFFPDISLTFPDKTNSPTFSSFPWPVGTLQKVSNHSFTSLTAFSCMLDAIASSSSVELNLRPVQAVVKLGTAFSGWGCWLRRHDAMS